MGQARTAEEPGEAGEVKEREGVFWGESSPVTQTYRGGRVISRSWPVVLREMDRAGLGPGGQGRQIGTETGCFPAQFTDTEAALRLCTPHGGPVWAMWSWQGRGTAGLSVP